MEYVKKRPSEPTFSQKGMDGFSYELNNKNVSIDLEKSYIGHEKYCTNTKSTHIFYVVSGSGKFKINNDIFNVEEGDIIEIPPKTEFVYSGKMDLLLVMNPSYNPDNDIAGKSNDLK